MENMLEPMAHTPTHLSYAHIYAFMAQVASNKKVTYCQNSGKKMKLTPPPPSSSTLLLIAQNTTSHFTDLLHTNPIAQAMENTPPTVSTFVAPAQSAQQMLPSSAETSPQSSFPPAQSPTQSHTLSDELDELYERLNLPARGRLRFASNDNSLASASELSHNGHMSDSFNELYDDTVAVAEARHSVIMDDEPTYDCAEGETDDHLPDINDYPEPPTWQEENPSGNVRFSTVSAPGGYLRYDKLKYNGDVIPCRPKSVASHDLDYDKPVDALPSIEHLADGGGLHQPVPVPGRRGASESLRRVLQLKRRRISVDSYTDPIDAISPQSPVVLANGIATDRQAERREYRGQPSSYYPGNQQARALPNFQAPPPPPPYLPQLQAGTAHTRGLGAPESRPSQIPQISPGERPLPKPPLPQKPGAKKQRGSPVIHGSRLILAGGDVYTLPDKKMLH